MYGKFGLILVAMVMALTAGIVYAGRLAAQPGSESDPAVSLSYLKTSMTMAPVTLEGGEEFAVKSGKTVVLLEGNAKLIPPDDDKCWISNVTTGIVTGSSVEMTVGGCYLLISNNPNSTFKLQTWKNSVIGLPGGSGE